MQTMTTVLPEPETWRELLATLISDKKDRERIVRITGITEVTLKRWARWKTNPRPYQLRPLLMAFPEYRDMLIRLIRKEFSTFSPSERPEFLTTLIDTEYRDENEHIPPELYEHVIAARSTDPTEHMFWSICNHVLRPAIAQLDQGFGMGIWVCQCVMSTEWNAIQNVRCLRERIQFGTAPWKNDLAPALLLGSESIAGYSVSKGQPAVCQNIRENTTFLPVRQEEFEESAAAFPLVQGEKIAGSLLITSTQPDYFTHTRLDLIQRYAQLVSLAFRDHEFYDRGEIHLRELPPTPIQRQHFSSFRQRVTDAMNLDGRKGLTNISEAEALVWSQFATELADRV